MRMVSSVVVICSLTLVLVLSMLALYHNLSSYPISYPISYPVSYPISYPVSYPVSSMESEITIEVSSLHDGKMFKFIREGRTLLYKDGIRLMKESEEFRSQIVHTISAQNYAAVFWEFPPVSQGSNPAFEFILNNARSLSRVKADKDTFRAHFRKDCLVTTFPNLGGDAELVVPCPASDSVNYAHVAAFLRTAPVSQVHELLRTIALRVEDWLKQSDRVLWLSTSGAGVYYLHVRLDSYPKYYTYTPYRKH